MAHLGAEGLATDAGALYRREEFFLARGRVIITKFAVRNI
jgi:hypothetical protein